MCTHICYTIVYYTMIRSNLIRRASRRCSPAAPRSAADE